MNTPDDTQRLMRRARPDLDAEEPALDFGRIMREGYRARRRNRLALGSATGAGVTAIAAVLALSVTGLPTGGEDRAPNEVDGAGGVDDAALAGYPFETDEEFGTDEERSQLNEAAAAAFGGLLVEAGLLEDGQAPSLDFGAVQTPGNYGQTWLRSFQTQVFADPDAQEDMVVRIEALLPGGWTPEAGPSTEQVFPQHLISAAGAPWHEDADWTDELTTEELDDGRVLSVANHECAFQAAIAYPNGTGLRVTWDMGCHEPAPEYGIALEDFTAAVEAMPEFDFDTTGLAPVGDLLDVPTGWTYDADWPAAAQEDAASSIDAARTAFEAAAPGTELGEGTAAQLGGQTYGAVNTRTYTASGEFPAEDGGIGFDLRYYLPGGWIPGIADLVERGPYPVVCPEDFACSQTTDDDGTVWVFAESESGRVEVVRFDPDGWAVGAWVDSPGVEIDSLGDLLAAAPAPVYDPDAVPTVPAD
jgi:hypothetical protein